MLGASAARFPTPLSLSITFTREVEILGDSHVGRIRCKISDSLVFVYKIHKREKVRAISDAKLTDM